MQHVKLVVFLYAATYAKCDVIYSVFTSEWVCYVSPTCQNLLLHGLHCNELQRNTTVFFLNVLTLVKYIL